MTTDPKPGMHPNNSGGRSPTTIDPVSLAGDMDTKTIIGQEAVTDGDVPPVDAGNHVGQKIGKYEIRAKLGAGGMGAVYLGFDSLIEREVAIKVLSNEFGKNPTAVRRFLQEARSIGRLNHPNVVSIYDIDKVDDQFFLVMELLSGGSLADLVDERGPLPWQEACRMIAQAALGLEAAHAAEMVHRDIKPENLMQTREGIVKVVDFGLSKLVDATQDTRNAMTKQGQILGTPQYMSPEQFEAAELDARTDIYSLGASLYRLITARFPFQECTSIVQTMLAHVSKPVPKVVDFNSQIPAECDRIIQKAMAKQRADRYQNAREMADDLIRLIQDQGGSWMGGTVMPRPGTESNRTNTIAAEITTDEIVPLQSVLIVEPSKMLAAMTKDAVQRAGAGQIEVLSSKGDVLNAIRGKAPDLLITAMQLPDGTATQMIAEVYHKVSLSRTCIVLNSSDSTIEELMAAAPAACRILAPKKVRPDDMLRVVHAAGPIQVTSGAIAMAIDPLNLRLVIMADLQQTPAKLVELIRQLELLDVSVIGPADSSSIPSDQVPTVILRLFRNITLAAERPSLESIEEHRFDPRHLVAEVDVDQETLKLTGVRRQGVFASTSRILDARRLTCLLQACRLS